MASQIFSIMLKNLIGTYVSFTNSLNHCPQRHCVKKASIPTTREQSVIVTSQLLATGSCSDDVTLTDDACHCGILFIPLTSGNAIWHYRTWSTLFQRVAVCLTVPSHYQNLQYIPRNMHTVFALLCFVVDIHWLIFPYTSGLLHWHCGNLTIAPVPAKQPWWIWINTSCEFIMNDCITTTKQSTTKPCAYFLGYTVCWLITDRPFWHLVEDTFTWNAQDMKQLNVLSLKLQPHSLGANVLRKPGWHISLLRWLMSKQLLN